MCLVGVLLPQDDTFTGLRQGRLLQTAHAYHDEVESMVASILDDVPPVIPLADSRQNTAVILALLQSAREKKSVALLQAANST